MTLILNEASSFPWGAAATMATGALAVIAAWQIGSRQTLILKRQTRLAENDLKIQLFERRANCVNQMRTIVSSWWSNADLTAEERSELHSLMFEVQLLFPADVVSEIEEVVGDALQLNWKKGRSQTYYERGKEDKAKEFLEQVFEHEDKLMKLMPSVLEKLKAATRIDLWD